MYSSHRSIFKWISTNFHLICLTDFLFQKLSWFWRNKTSWRDRTHNWVSRDANAINRLIQNPSIISCHFNHIESFQKSTSQHQLNEKKNCTTYFSKIRLSVIVIGLLLAWISIKSAYDGQFWYFLSLYWPYLIQYTLPNLIQIPYLTYQFTVSWIISNFVYFCSA